MCLRFVPVLRRIVQPDGWTTVKVSEFVQLQPEPVAVTVMLPAASPAVSVTLRRAPVFGLKVPPPLTVQVAGLPVTVKVTSSPTPIVVRVRSAGDVAMVCEASVQAGWHC